MKRRKGTSIALLQDRFNNVHAFHMRMLKGREDYIIKNLSLEDAVRLYQQTNDERYVEHVFFSNLGYFMNTIVSTMALYGDNFRYTNINDYLCYAYEGLRHGMQVFDFGVSNKVLSYLAGSVFLRLRRAIRDYECRWWNEYNFREQDEHDDESYNEGIEYYKRSSEEVFDSNKNFFDVNNILNELFERFQDKLKVLNIESLEQMFLLFGSLKHLDKAKRSYLLKLRKEMRLYLREKYKDFF